MRNKTNKEYVGSILAKRHGVRVTSGKPRVTKVSQRELEGKKGKRRRKDQSFPLFMILLKMESSPITAD